MATTTITDVRTIGVDVTDQDAAIAFYTGTLGFETRLDARVNPTMRWVEVAPAGAAVSLALIATDRAAGVIDTGIRFAVPDAEAEHALLEAAGVIVGELLRWPGVPPMFTAQDPDGNRFEVVEAPR